MKHRLLFFTILKCNIGLPGLQQMKELEHQSLKNLHILGSKMGDCATIAVSRLSRDSGASSGASSSSKNQNFR